MQQQTKRAAGQAPAAPRRKQVVTAVVENPQNGNVLLVLRSDKVGVSAVAADNNLGYSK